MDLKCLEKRGFIILLSVLFLNLVVLNIAMAQESGDKKTINPNVPGLLTYKDKNGVTKPVTSLREWEKKRRQILDSMQSVMGKLPERSGLPPLDVKVSETFRGDNYTRLTINFTIAENENASAYLYLPLQQNIREKLPAMVVLHGTGDLGKQLVDGGSPLANRAIAKELAQRGYIVIAPDYPSFGDQKDYDFDHDRYESGTMKAIFNHMRCVDLLQSRAEVDPDRIGVIGHSLGGHNSMFVGAFDKRIKVIVSSCGWTLFDYYNAGEAVTLKFGGRLGPWAQKRYMPLFLERYKQDGDKTPFDFDEVIATFAPRPFFSNSPLHDANFDVNGVKKGIENASEVYHLFKTENNLQVCYPESGHDFPTEVRLEAYRFVDKVLKNKPLMELIN
jgi:pimeloyl-ACP methyl ester carboxylesterase